MATLIQSNGQDGSHVQTFVWVKTAGGREGLANQLFKGLEHPVAKTGKACKQDEQILSIHMRSITLRLQPKAPPLDVLIKGIAVALLLIALQLHSHKGSAVKRRMVFARTPEPSGPGSECCGILDSCGDHCTAVGTSLAPCDMSTCNHTSSMSSHKTDGERRTIPLH